MHLIRSKRFALRKLFTVNTENPAIIRGLPIAGKAKAAARRSIGQAPPAKAPFNSKPRILVVDDEKPVADSLVFLLKHEGFDAIAAYSGEEARQSAMANPLDLLISDVVMFGIDGVEAAIDIRKHSPACRVILFSGHENAPALVESAASRGYDFELIQKPLHPQELLSKLRIVLTR